MNIAQAAPTTDRRSGMFRVTPLRALRLGTRLVLTGVEVEIDARTAAELLRNGAVRLVDAADIGLLFDATLAQRQRQHDGR